MSQATSLAVEYRALRGFKLYRMRNMNAPLPATGQRPDLAFLNIDRFESSGFSRSNALTVTFRTGYDTSRTRQLSAIAGVSESAG